MTTQIPLLVIDDDRQTANLLRIMLKKDGYNVTIMNSGIDGLRHIETNRPAAVLLDLMMPIMNGWEVLEAIRNNKDLDDLPVVIVSAEATEQDKVMGQANGANAYLTKPFRKTAILETLATVLSEHATTRPAESASPSPLHS